MVMVRNTVKLTWDIDCTQGHVNTDCSNKERGEGIPTFTSARGSLETFAGSKIHRGARSRYQTLNTHYFYIVFVDAYLKTFHEIDVEIAEVLVDQVDNPLDDEDEQTGTASQRKETILFLS